MIYLIDLPADSFIRLMNTTELTQNFEELGLSHTQALILSNLAELPEINVTDLAKRTNISRGSIYRHLDELEQKGYIAWILDTKGKKVSINNLLPIKTSIDDSRKELDKKEDLLNTLSIEVSKKRELNSTKPTVRYYEGKEGIKQLIWNTLESKSTIKVFTNSFRKELLGEKWLTDYTLEFVKRNLRDQVLGDEIYANEYRKKYVSRENYFGPVKQFPQISSERIIKSPLLKIQGEIYIYDSIIASYSWENNSLIGSEIRSEYLSTTQSTIFDLLWSQTSEENTIDKFLIP